MGGGKHDTKIGFKGCNQISNGRRGKYADKGDVNACASEARDNRGFKEFP